MRTRTAALAAAAGAALLAPASFPAAAQQPLAEPVVKSPGGAASSGREAGAGGADQGGEDGGGASYGDGAYEGRRYTGTARTPGTPGAPGAPATPGREGSVRAADLLARTGSCKQISHGKFRTDDGARATVPVCAKRGAVFWKADMDIDCDGQPTKACNRRTDPLFFHATAFQQSDGRQLNAERLPYVVVPGASRRWKHAAHGITGGTVAAVIYRGRVQYAVVGDTGPTDLIGEASYATAKALGIRPDPRSGGVGSGVTYIFFKGPKAAPIESHPAAVARGEALARRFVRQN
ncbi:glycoside hydrolase family 75 protein [Streptomyces sp. NPDC087300]|uniref:glycoside hydrolase family 75 protein n=1 Tax=Streptomyces sp. NPDC087300 TaxID=3365780 RepID=UPI003811C241